MAIQLYGNYWIDMLLHLRFHEISLRFVIWAKPNPNVLKPMLTMTCTVQSVSNPSSSFCLNREAPPTERNQLQRLPQDCKCIIYTNGHAHAMCSFSVYAAKNTDVTSRKQTRNKQAECGFPAMLTEQFL